MTFKVVIIEDNDVTRVMLKKRVDECEMFSVIATYADFNSSMNGLDEITPDVLLVDLDLPDGSGIEIIRRESQRHPKLAIMVISVFADEVHVLQAIQAGARGYLLKDSDSSEIGDSINQLLAGGSPISPSIARHLIKKFQTEHEVKEFNENAIKLSDREFEVLKLASKGFSYAETAKILDISVNTVASYTKRIYGKLEVSSRSEAVYEATKMGVINNSFT